MKKIFTLFISFFTFATLQAQTRGFHTDKPIDMKAVLAAKQPSLATGFSTISEARTIINDIMSAVGEQQNFTVASTTQVDNAAAVTYQGKRYILYNPSFINQLDEVANDRWASISVVAHEIGHHLLGHTLDGRGSQIPKELGADEFSGLVLKRMGASLQQAQLAMGLVSAPYASATHPAQKDRLAAIAKGWNSTNTVSNNKDIAIEYPENDRRTYPSDNRSSYPTENNFPDRRRQTFPQQDRRQQQGNRRDRRTNTNTQTVIYDVRFNQSNRVQYYITNQNNVVVGSGNRMTTVAKIASSNKRNYPYIIYDDQQQFLVDKKGNIYTERGQQVGRITPHI